jgi:hypothetical protein
MGRTKSNLIELFVDKAVLAIAVIAALVVLFLFVIGSPNAIEYANKKLTPGQIDESIYEKAAKLQKKLNEDPNKNDEKYKYEPKVSLYLDLVKNAVKNVNANINFPLPAFPAGTTIAPNRVYQLPDIGKIEKLSVATVRMAAFVPTEELSDTVTYDMAETKLADVDLVTVESNINAKNLYESFKSAFTGKNVPEEWRIERYAKPVFAKVELQRRTQQSDGSWSQWDQVPQTKICNLKKMLQLPKQADEYEIQIAMVQFAKTEFRNEILQPPVYDNAIPGEKWISPSFFNGREKRLAREQAEQKKQQLELEKARKLDARSTRTRQPATRQQAPSQSQTGDTGGVAGRPPKTSEMTKHQTPTKPSLVQKQPLQKTPAPEETRQNLTEEQQFKEISLSEKINPAELEKLVFWAHDDTTKPGEKYQYRIRIGVFNPIAGTNWFSQEQKDLKTQTVLFSSFSEPTAIIEIPERLYFFATDIREIEKGYSIDRTVEIKVARYTLGNWVSETFSVKNGEQIGTVSDKARARLEKALEKVDTQPESIDLSTGAVMVDTRLVTEWAGAGYLRSKDFYELLYTQTGDSIQTMPIKERFWPDGITKVYKEIEQAEKAEPIALMARSGAPSRARTTPTETGTQENQ